MLPSRRGGSASSGLTCNDGDSEPCSCEEVRPRLQASIPRWFDVLSCRAVGCAERERRISRKVAQRLLPRACGLGGAMEGVWSLRSLRRRSFGQPLVAGIAHSVEVGSVHRNRAPVFQCLYTANFLSTVVAIHAPQHDLLAHATLASVFLGVVLGAAVAPVQTSSFPPLALAAGTRTSYALRASSPLLEI